MFLVEDVMSPIAMYGEFKTVSPEICATVYETVKYDKTKMCAYGGDKKGICHGDCECRPRSSGKADVGAGLDIGG